MATKRKASSSELEASVEPRAIGDDAAAAGMDLVPATAPVTGGDDEINKTRDYIAQRAKRTSPTIDIYVQATAPAHSPGRVWIKTG